MFRNASSDETIKIQPLSNLCRFEGFTGELLLQYKSVMKTAPEYFYSSLDIKLKLDLVTSLKFSKALNTLAGNT